MQLGVIGLGRMGSGIVRRLARHGHSCVVFDRDPAAVAALAPDSVGATALADMVAKLKPPRAVWVMLPSGDPTEHTVLDLAAALAPDDIVIDGGNSYFKDDVRRAAALAPKRIHYVDVGTSGGVWGLERGFCMMIGGVKAAVDRLDPIFAALAPGLGDIPRTPGREGRDKRVEQGYLHCGPPGAGHFVKMVHNGVEYGLMQAYAEGFDILRNATSKSLPEGQRFALDLADVAEVWRRGSVISSWLLDLTAISLAKDPELDAFTGKVEDSGEGRWTVTAAVEEGVPADTIAHALFARFRSRAEHLFGEKLLSAMRNEFGGHVEPGAKTHG